MHGHTGKWTALAALLLAASAGRGKPAAKPAPASKLPAYKEAAIAIAVGSVQGLELAGKVADQKARALENWKKLFEDAAPAHLETEHLLLYGKVPDRTLKDVGELLEKQFVVGRDALKLDRDALWPGKLAVYFLPERRKFASFVRSVEKRRPESDERGSFDIRSDFPHLAASPPREEGDPGLDAQAGEQLAAALLTKKAGPTVPEWVVAGFGRASQLRAGPPAALRAEKQRAYRFAAKGRSAMDVWSNKVKGAEAAVLRGSLVDFLAFGPGKKNFIAFLEAFKPEEGVMTKTTAEALKAARMDAGVVSKKWKAWLRSGK